MDLKTFAVRQKLKHDHHLLDYVVKNKDVPIGVLEESFQEILHGLVDAKASQLITDPDTLLGTEVPVLIKRDAEGGYEIEGDIPDTLMEAIQLVHDKTADAVVKSLVNYNMGILYGQHCDVVSVTLQEEAEKTVMSMADMPAIVPLQDLAQAQRDIFEELEQEQPEMIAIPEAVENQAPEVAKPDLIIEPEEPEEEPEDLLEEPEDLLEPVEAPEPELSSEEQEANDFRASVRRIYDKLVADIRNFGLDERLQLNL